MIIDIGYRRKQILARRDALVLEHLPMVTVIANSVARNLPPSFDLADLVQTGTLALMRAALRYRPRGHAGTPFRLYARQHVRGAIIDSVRRKRYTENTRPGLDVRAAVEAIAPDARTDEAIDRGRERKRLAEAISWLPMGEQRVLREYYAPHEPTLAEVSSKLRIGRRATSKLHASAIASLRDRFRAL